MVKLNNRLERAPKGARSGSTFEIINLMKKYVIGLLVLTAFLWTCWFSFTIYTSLMSKELPWYEPCGMQFLAILIISCPLLVLIGLVDLFLSRCIKLSRTLKLLPFCTAGILGLLVIIDGSLGFTMQIIGSLTCVTAMLLAVTFFVLDVKKWKAFEPAD